MYNSALSVGENILVDIAQLFASLSLHIKHSHFVSPSTQPDQIKTYSVRPELGDHRVFLPASYQSSGTADHKLPLIITVHGSAWIVGNPSDDDALNRHLADHVHAVVVGINYRKAPQHPFPHGLGDIIALIPAVVHDPDLPIDPARVVFCGGSAGANLLLAAVQDAALHTAVSPVGLVAICPPVDLVTPKEAKLARRRRPTAPDALARFYDVIVTTYLAPAQDSPARDDPRLSPCYFTDRAVFPRNVYVIGFEDDLLCHEAEELAKKLAAEELADGRPRETTPRGWKAGGVTWEMIEKCGHGFAAPRGETADEKRVREDEHEALYDRLAVWISSLVEPKQSTV